MPLESSRNGRLEVSPFSASSTSGTVSLIRRDALSNTSGLTAPGSLNTCPMYEGQRCTMLLWYSVSVRKTQQFRVESVLKTFCQFGTGGTRSANSAIDSSSLFQLRHPKTLIQKCITIIIKDYCYKTLK